MRSLDNIPASVYKILIVVATIIWGFSFVVMKDLVTVFPPAWLLGVRFLLAGGILLAIIWKHVRRTCTRQAILAGIALGAFDFAAFLAQTVGLQHTTPGINAFLTATYCVIVPFLWWLIARRRPTVFNIGAAVIAVIGIWLVSSNSSSESFAMGLGEAMTLLGAFLFALHMVYVSKFARKNDVLVLTVVQFISEGAFGIIVGGFTETPPALALVTPEIVGSLLFLSVFASVIAFGIQNLALAHIPPSQGALLLSLESVFGVVFSVLLYGELVTLRLLAGFALIFVAIVISEVFPLKPKQPAQP